MNKNLFKTCLILLLLSLSFVGHAGEIIKPFVLGSDEAGKVADKIAVVKAELQQNGFTIAGEYSPYAGTHIIIITNDQLLKAAASHDRAGYIAAQRVALTQREGNVQVSYTYPPYMAGAYWIKSGLGDVVNKLKSALGFKQLYGPATGKTVEELNKYHYMFGMEYFDDELELASYGSHQQAVEAVEKNLAAGNMGATKIYRIDIPGTEQTLIGVGMKKYAKGNIKGNKFMDDEFIMSEIDFKELRSSAHLPYELLIKGAEVEALHARFRIAINFTDLSMMGDNSFMNIMSTPDAIYQTLVKVAGGSNEDEF